MYSAAVDFYLESLVSTKLNEVVNVIKNWGKFYTMVYAYVRNSISNLVSASACA